MKLFVSNPRGFCAGVVRAIETVKRALDMWGVPIYVKHKIVHNSHVIRDLEHMGVVFVEDLDEVPRECRIIYSAHGVSPAVRAHAKRRNLIEIDASCVLVTRIHSAVMRFAGRGYRIILIGHKKHIEVVGTAGHFPHLTTIIESVEDVEELEFTPDQKLFYITQTTFSLSDVEEITRSLKLKYPHIETLPTSSICYATTNRQLALREIAQFVDVVLVIGDSSSSNSNRLREIAVQQGICGYLVNDSSEIDPKWLTGVSTIGLAAGASTPEPVVQRCIEHLQSLGVSEVEEIKYMKEDVLFQLPKSLCVN